MNKVYIELDKYLCIQTLQHESHFTSDVGEIAGAWEGVDGANKTSAQHRAEIDAEVASSQTVSVPAKLAPCTVR